MADKYSFGTPVKPKVEDPRAALAEWVWRKCRNHDPLRERYGEKGHPLTDGRLKHIEGTSFVEYEAGGRKFRITVEEIGSESSVSFEGGDKIFAPVDEADDGPGVLLLGQDD
jgi:hypothetical protein